jgi:hypothetical protein
MQAQYVTRPLGVNTSSRQARLASSDEIQSKIPGVYGLPSEPIASVYTPGSEASSRQSIRLIPNHLNHTELIAMLPFLAPRRYIPKRVNPPASQGRHRPPAHHGDNIKVKEDLQNLCIPQHDPNRLWHSLAACYRLPHTSVANSFCTWFSSRK